MSANNLRDQRLKRSAKPISLAVESTLEKLETRLLFDSTINVVATSGGSFGGADVSSVVIFEDANNNGVLDGGENWTTLTSNPDDDTDATGTLNINDDGHTVYLAAKVPANEFVWGGNPADEFTADGTEDGQTYWVPIGPYSSVSGKVFEDFNGSGTQETDDFAMSGWTVYVDTNGNGSYDTGEPSTTTDSSGNYAINGAFLGDTVNVVLPDSSWYLDYPSASCGGGGHVISSAVESDNFGVQGPISIAGTVWTDSNDNGTRDSGENAVTGNSGWTVFDDVNENGQLDSGEPTTTVASNGTYSLDTSGSISCHHVMLIPPADWRVTSPTDDIEIIPNSACHCGTTTFSSYDFGVTQKGMISGSVFEDMNAQVSPLLSNPGLNGITMTLVDATTLSTVATTTTDSSGKYSFRDITIGTDPYEAEAGLSSLPSGFAAEATTSPSMSLSCGDFQTADFPLQRVLPAPANATASETVSSGYKSITVSWDNTVNGSVSSYGFRIYQSTNGGAFTLAQTLASSMSSYTFSSLSTINSYAYVVTTYDSNGNSAYSNVANSEAAPAPTDIVAAAQLGTVTLSWTPGSGTPSGTIYSVYRYDGANSDNPVLVNNDVTTTTFTDSSVFLNRSGKQFRYEIVPNYPPVAGYGSGGGGSGDGVGGIVPVSGQISYSQNVVLEAQAPVAGATTAYADAILVPHPFGLSGSVTATDALFGFNDSALLMARLGGSGNGRFWVDGSSGHDGTGGTLDTFSLDNSASGDLPDSYSNTSPLATFSNTSTMYFHEKITICSATNESLQAGLGGLYIITYTYTS